MSGTQPIISEEIHSTNTDIPIRPTPSSNNLVKITVFIDYSMIALYGQASCLI